MCLLGAGSALTRGAGRRLGGLGRLRRGRRGGRSALGRGLLDGGRRVLVLRRGKARLQRRHQVGHRSSVGLGRSADVDLLPLCLALDHLEYLLAVFVVVLRGVERRAERIQFLGGPKGMEVSGEAIPEVAAAKGPSGPDVQDDVISPEDIAWEE